MNKFSIGDEISFYGALVIVKGVDVYPEDTHSGKGEWIMEGYLS